MSDVTVIRPSTGWARLNLGEVWKYRGLLFFLTWRDVKIRYKQTAFGAAWAVLQPVLTMMIFTVIFGRLAKIPSDGVPYPIFAFAALVPWTFFANALTQASNSLVNNPSLITKIYFPRLVVPMASVAGGLLDFGIASTVLIVMMLAYSMVPTAAVLWLPGLVLLALSTALGVGLWLSAINVRYRDVRFVVPFLTQLWLFATPIAYPSTLVPEPWRVVYALNPMVGVVEGFRWTLLDTDTSPGPMILVSALASVVILISGAFYFRRMERTFADIV